MKLSTGLAFIANLLVLLTASCSSTFALTEKVFEQTYEELKQLLHDNETRDSAQVKFLLDAHDVDHTKCHRDYLQELRNHEVSYRFNHQLALAHYLDQCEQKLVEHCAGTLDNLIKGGLDKFNQDETERIDDLMFHLKNPNLARGLLSFMITSKLRFEHVENICSELTTELGPALKLYRDDHSDLRDFLTHRTRKWLTNLELCEKITRDKAILLTSLQELSNREKEIVVTSDFLLQ